ncbi:M23 family metallopeptidase, partial [Patescibacteria group bacterium]|nr:M23 family metallopeptidase [Patescibacteria group bacterium]
DDPNSIIKFSVNIPDFLDYKETRLILSDERADRDTEKDPIYLPDLSTTPLPNTHGGRVELIFTPLPAAYDTENGNSEITLLITVIPAIVGPDGNDHFADFEITDLSELDWYINQLPSDDRLANLEFNAQWANTRSVDLLSFWIGQGVLSTQNPPCKYDTAPCFTDAEALPYGWPNLGVVSQDWGGIEDINAEDTVVWSNPLADIYGPRYETLEQEGAYLNCGTEIDPEWINAGIDITPPGGTTWSPEVFSTHAGHVTHVGESPDYDNDGAPDYPGRGYYVEIQSTTDDDCQPNFLTRYANLAHGSIRVGVGEYVPRHKLLGLMGDSGTPGYVHLHYTIREGNPQQDPDLADIPDNNVGLWHPQNVDADIDPPFPNYLDWQEPDDVRQPYYADSCDENPYRCNTGSPGELTSTPAELDLYGSCAGEYPPRFFCTVRRREDEIRSCYYANP